MTNNSIQSVYDLFEQQTKKNLISTCEVFLPSVLICLVFDYYISTCNEDAMQLFITNENCKYKLDEKHSLIILSHNETIKMTVFRFQNNYISSRRDSVEVCQEFQNVRSFLNFCNKKQLKIIFHQLIGGDNEFSTLFMMQFSNSYLKFLLKLQQ